MSFRPFVALALLATLPVVKSRAFLGVADTSFVTVIANPAEAANWAAQIERLTSQLETAQSTLQVAGDLRSYAGDPRAAVAALGDLSAVTGGAAAVGDGVATEADLARAWQSAGSSGQASGESSLLQAVGGGNTMTVFGQQQPRDLPIYGTLAADAAATLQIRGQVSREQAVRALVAAGLTAAWTRFRSQTTESGKQAVLAEISQLQSQDQVMAARRRALLDDLELSDRESSSAAGARQRAQDEQHLAESSALNSGMVTRAQLAETQRLSTLQKAPRAPSQADYSGMKLWTTADAGGSAN